MLGLLLLVASASPAAIIFDNSPHDLVTGTGLSELLVAEDFVLASAQSLTAVRFWSAQLSAADSVGTIDWVIYADSAGLPGSVLFSGSAANTNVATGLTAASGLQFEFVNDFLISGTLAPGTYWIGLHNGPISDTTFRDFNWGSRAANATATGQYQDLTLGPNPPWTDSLTEHAFILFGDIPEPSTWVLVGSAVGLLAFARRFRSQGASSNTEGHS
ncbi:MAG: PEP-CTERM sorting domain-containing protein [Acidobacteria bacterium]|nr:PEP-CTERM sorting domain-containing protein [Acidobacteriota bacterium]